jgi:hypothetical protein
MCIFCTPYLHFLLWSLSCMSCVIGQWNSGWSEVELCNVVKIDICCFILYCPVKIITFFALYSFIIWLFFVCKYIWYFYRVFVLIIFFIIYNIFIISFLDPNMCWFSYKCWANFQFVLQFLEDWKCWLNHL